MKILLTTIGSRGDVQPILALALELQTLGHQALVCVAPNFKTWVESYGVEFAPIGIDLEKWTQSRAEAPKTQQKPTQEQLRGFARFAVVDQFKVLTEAAQGCDLVLVAGMAQTAGKSVADALNIPYVFVAYCPTVLPSADHAPAKMDMVYSQSLTAGENLSLWEKEESSFNDLFLDAINEQRAQLGLMAIDNVLRYISTDHPLLAADPVLAPAASPINMQINQTGAWLLPNQTSLPEDLETFLANGEPPIYFGFGSMSASDQTSQMLIDASRTLGYRAIISQGWGGLHVVDSGDDCISIGDVNHDKLFPRVVAIVHHGGAGTTTSSARAGTPQVIIPHIYDQYYWANRLQNLGIGISGLTSAELTVDVLVDALEDCLKPEMRIRTQSLASQIKLNGAHIAAQQITKVFA